MLYAFVFPTCVGMNRTDGTPGKLGGVFPTCVGMNRGRPPVPGIL